MKIHLYARIIVVFCWIGVVVFTSFAGEFEGVFSDASVEITEVIHNQSIIGTVDSPRYDLQQCQLVVYVWANGWRRFAAPQHDIIPLQVMIHDEGSWVISLNNQEPLTPPFSVLLVEASKVVNLPEYTETIAAIDHLGKAIHTRVLHGTDTLRLDGLTNQDRVDSFFGVLENFISPFLHKLHTRHQSLSPSDETILVLILGNVNYPGIYEVNRKFTFASVLEAAQGYRGQGYHDKESPYSVIIIRNITEVATVYEIVYREWRVNPDREEFFLEEGDILYFPIMV